MDQQLHVAHDTTDANAPKLWDEIWRKEGADSWRGTALSAVYDRVVQLVPEGSRVIDVGGGVGQLARRLVEEKSCTVEVWEHSQAALDQLPSCVTGRLIDLEGDDIPLFPTGCVVVGTEILEHLHPSTVGDLLRKAHATAGKCFFSTPNNCMGPDVESQHRFKWTALDFLGTLRSTWGVEEGARVEVFGRYMLGVCGFPKPYKLSLTLPVRDEERDLEAVLASFRGVADEMVIGVDPRTVDGTREVAEQYAEVVFDLDSPTGPPGTPVPEKGVHFAHVRNQCIERCTGDWIFMTEGHERLYFGEDVLLSLHELVPGNAAAVLVMRYGGPPWLRQRWAFPWLFRPWLRFARDTHNVLVVPPTALQVALPTIATLHERHDERTKQRYAQRKTQNRKTLAEDWFLRQDPRSLFYLGQESRFESPEASVKWLEQYLALPKHVGTARYQARLMLAQTYYKMGQKKDCRRVLVRASEDDWGRTEHYLWLGDLAFEAGQFSEAWAWYTKCATTIGEPPFTTWWIDMASYGFLPAQRLTMTAGELGRPKDALYWAQRVVELLPEEAPPEMFEEARQVVAQVEDALAKEDGNGSST